jgi:hypothetical protein
MAKRIRIITIFFILAILVIVNSNAMGQGHPGGMEEETKTAEINYEGNTNEGDSWDKSVDLVKEAGLEVEEITLKDINFELTWTDDQGSGSEPDTFSVKADDGGAGKGSGTSADGVITFTVDSEGLNDTWNVQVSCDDAGFTPFRPGGIVGETDPGNSWSLSIKFSYTEGEGMGGMGGGPPANVVAVLESPIFAVHIALMVASVFLFLITGLVAGAFLFTRVSSRSPSGFSSTMNKLFDPPALLIFLVLITFIAFFIASVPIGMWVAGNFYGWEKAWTGFPALWNPEAFEMTNADNVSFIVLLFWAVPMYINRAQIMRSKYYKKLFGWSKFAMKRAEKAPDPKIPTSILALCYFFMGIFTFVIFEVQPHGSG